MAGGGPPARLVQDDLVVIAALDCAGEPEETPEATVARLQELAALYLDGCRRLLIVDGTGLPGDRASAPHTLRMFARLLEVRSLPPVKVRRVGSGAKAAVLLADHAEELARTAQRRRLFPHPDDALPAEAEKAAALAALQALHIVPGETPFAVLPRIDPARCSGCDACLTACPCGVLTQVNDKSGESSYAVKGASCDGCGLCVGVCASAAIDIVLMTPEPEKIVLTHWTCAACGVPVHAPAAQAPHGDGLCGICRQNGHHKKLYQVLT